MIFKCGLLISYVADTNISDNHFSYVCCDEVALIIIFWDRNEIQIYP